MPFERFTKAGRGYTPKVAIWSRGQIGFNRGANEKFNLDKFDYAVLYFDRLERKIGIKFTNEPEEGATKLIKGKTGAFISSKAFLDYYDIPHAKTKKYLANYDEKEQMVVLALEREEQQLEGLTGSSEHDK